MLFYQNLITKCYISKKFFSNVLSSCTVSNKFLTENVEGLITTFGGKKCDEKNFLKAEDLVKNWRSLFYPTNESGSRSYAMIGKKSLCK